MAMAACLLLDDRSINKNTPGILVALLSQSRASLRKLASRSSIAMVILYKIGTHILRLAVLYLPGGSTTYKSGIDLSSRRIGNNCCVGSSVFIASKWKL